MENSDWQTVKLGENVSFVTGKLDSNAATFDGIYPFFTCSRETFRTGTFSFDTECVLLAGNNAAGIFPIKYFDGKFDAYQRTYIIEPLNRMELSTRFLYYALQLQLEYMKSVSTGAATKFLTKTILDGLEITIPKFEIQNRIANILSAYDDLIEVNTRRIRILEGMTQSIYQEWFGRVDEQSMPDGWQLLEVKHIIERLPKGNVYEQNYVTEKGEVIIIDQSRAEYLGFHANVPDFEASPSKPVAIFGDHTCKMQLMVRPFSIGPNVVPFTSKQGYPIHFVFSVVNGLIETKDYKRHWNDLVNKKITLPPIALANSYSEIIEPMLAQQDMLAQKNTNLRKTRDLLLPRLVSGEVPVNGLFHGIAD